MVRQLLIVGVSIGSITYLSGADEKAPAPHFFSSDKNTAALESKIIDKALELEFVSRTEGYRKSSIKNMVKDMIEQEKYYFYKPGEKEGPDRAVPCLFYFDTRLTYEKTGYEFFKSFLTDELKKRENGEPTIVERFDNNCLGNSVTRFKTPCIFATMIYLYCSIEGLQDMPSVNVGKAYSDIAVQVLIRKDKNEQQNSANKEYLVNRFLQVNTSEGSESEDE